MSVYLYQKKAQKTRGDWVEDIQKNVIGVSCKGNKMWNTVYLYLSCYINGWWIWHIALCGSCRVLGVYLYALESMNIYNINLTSPEQNINKVLWPVSLNDNDRCRASNFSNFCFFIVTGNSRIEQWQWIWSMINLEMMKKGDTMAYSW